MNLFNQWWAHIRFNTYISCQGGARVRVPYYADGTEQLNLMFSPVAYMNQDQVHAAINTVIENIKAAANFLRTLDREFVIAQVFNMLLAGVTCVKHEGFEEEREWRAIYTPKRAASPLITSSTEVIGGVPQIIFQIPLDKSVSPALAELDLVSMSTGSLLALHPIPGRCTKRLRMRSRRPALPMPATECAYPEFLYEHKPDWVRRSGTGALAA